MGIGTSKRLVTVLHTASFILCKNLGEFHSTSVVEGILVDEMPMFVLLLLYDDTQQLP
jgi:hypothetical protein